MEFIPTNHLLEFNKDQLISIRKQYNLDRPGDMSRAIDVLEAWIKTQKHFMRKELPRNFLEKAILANKGSIERAKQRLDKICTFKTLMPHFFGENLKNIFRDLDVFKSTLLPKPTDENYRVYFLKSTGLTYTSDQISIFYRCVVLICEYIMAYDYSDGVIIVIDYNDTNVLEIVKALNLTELRQIISIVTEGFGMRLKEIHMLTASKAIETFVSIIKPLLNPKLGQRINIHKDLNSLYRYVPKDMLPMEYGGKEKSVVKLRDDLIDELTRKEFTNYIEEMNEAKTDESCRQSDTFNEKYLGTPGSFRILNVD